jgi:hypothetical protein
MALKDCITIDPLTKKNIPCNLITPFPETTTCTSIIAKYYNSTPVLIGEHPMGNFDAAGRCNVSFNFTTPDTYTINFSNGDAARIIVEKEDNMLAIIVGLIAISIFFAGIALMNPGTDRIKLYFRIFGYTLSFAQLVTIAFILHANELNASFAHILKINFMVLFVLGGIMGILAFIMLTYTTIAPDEVEQDARQEQPKW